MYFEIIVAVSNLSGVSQYIFLKLVIPILHEYLIKTLSYFGTFLINSTLAFNNLVTLKQTRFRELQDVSWQIAL